jgi:hypothetical protein
MRKFEANSQLFNENLRNVWPASTAFVVDSLFSDSLLAESSALRESIGKAVVLTRITHEPRTQHT